MHSYWSGYSSAHIFLSLRDFLVFVQLLYYRGVVMMKFQKLKGSRLGPDSVPVTLTFDLVDVSLELPLSLVVVVVCSSHFLYRRFLLRLVQMSSSALVVCLSISW